MGNFENVSSMGRRERLLVDGPNIESKCPTLPEAGRERDEVGSVLVIVSRRRHGAIGWAAIGQTAMLNGCLEGTADSCQRHL